MSRWDVPNSRKMRTPISSLRYQFSREDAQTREQAAFRRTQEQPGNHESSIALNKPRAETYESPGSHDERHKSVESDSLDEKGSRDLDADVQHVEYRDGRIQLVALEVNIRRQALSGGEPDIPLCRCWIQTVAGI